MPAEGMILSGVFLKNEDCSRMALWRSPRQRVPKVKAERLCESLRQKDREDLIPQGFCGFFS